MTNESDIHLSPTPFYNINIFGYPLAKFLGGLIIQDRLSPGFLLQSVPPPVAHQSQSLLLVANIDGS